MPIVVAIPDECNSLAEAVTRLVAKTEQVLQRARGGRAVEYGQIERAVGAATAAVERPRTPAGPARLPHGLLRDRHVP